ncbi:MAG: molybdenum cofactor guanylyltransferase MobA [Aestuariivirga sp.]
MSIAGVIIAGGRSSRMGGAEKVFVKIRGRSILDRIIDHLAPQVTRLAINANGDATRFANTGLGVIADLPDAAEIPLAGLQAALHWTKAQGFNRLLTVPSDTPFLPRDLVGRLSGQQTAIAASGGQAHYLTGLWPVSLCAALDGWIASTQTFRAEDWANHANAARIEWQTDPFDPFFNVNTPEDLARAEKIASEFDP